MSVRVNRKCSKWRKRMFDVLVERDGAACAECSAPDQIIWRQNGVTSTGQKWGEAPWECWRATLVYPTSNLEVEHTLALSSGGSNDPANLKLICVDCHKRKTSSERSARRKVAA